MIETVFPHVVLADGSISPLLTGDALVASYINKPTSQVPLLLNQINDDRIYAEFFASRSGLVFLDIGANIGFVSIYASPSCARIVAVEPCLETFEMLQRMTVNIPVIETVRAALTPKDGPCTFFVNDTNTTASSTINDYGDKITVPGLTLISLLKQNGLSHVDVCKIDAEGSESVSLSLETLTEARSIIDCYYIEFHNCPGLRWEFSMAIIKHRLENLGYTVSSYVTNLTARLP